VSYGGAKKKAVGRAPQGRFSIWSDYVPTSSRTFDQVAQASIEKNREVLRELAKY
jgi:hypothetical protein